MPSPYSLYMNIIWRDCTLLIFIKISAHSLLLLLFLIHVRYHVCSLSQVLSEEFSCRSAISTLQYHSGQEEVYQYNAPLCTYMHLAGDSACTMLLCVSRGRGTVLFVASFRWCSVSALELGKSSVKVDG